MSRSLFIHASNVHQGGGRSLLLALIDTLPDGLSSILSLDSRMPLPKDMPSSVHVRRVEPSFLQRLAIERWLPKTVNSGDIVLCFGNLPPLFKLRGHVILYIQNRYLVDDVKFSDSSIKIKLKFWLERLWLYGRLSNVDEIIVQTPSMKALIEFRTKGKIPVEVLPFIDSNNSISRKIRLFDLEKDKKFDFLYVASGEIHKNHRSLIKAWCLLAKEGLYPSLKLTLDALQFSELCIWIELMKEQYQLNISNAGNVDSKQVKKLYSQTGALIYPSTMESFGLPLIESMRANIPVIASELDYVRDVLDPQQTFDPESSQSIARAVKRFLDINEQDLPLHDVRSFLTRIIKSVE
jgi:glycosyltransferase involved in cell wall biosynthesis